MSESKVESAMVELDAGGRASVHAMPELKGYHAHLYSTSPDSSAGGDPELTEIYARAGRELDGVQVGRLHHEPIGPHPRKMFQLAFSRADIVFMLPWLIEHRAAHSVLIHPVLGNALLEHTEAALWLGPPLELDVSLFGDHHSA
ncbi:MAG: aromatic ring-cleaving dioxygenase [Myxococcota bacterium]|jgi:aromatic ring-cleaving dioxygenase